MTLEILTSDILSPVRHGFFTRRGGASSGVYEGLNCGEGSSDQRDMVKLNRARVAEAMEVAPENLLSLHQVHSDIVVPAQPALWTGGRPRGDAMVTDKPGVSLGVLTADCAPVLFADAEAGIVGAAHAGWKGALGGVLEATLDAMVGLGARRGQICAVVGPTISQRAYEVGPELLDIYLNSEDAYSRFFAQGEGDRFQFDLPGFCLHRLRSAGVAEAEWINQCTYSDAGRFFSYRRGTHAGESDYGRLIAAIAL